MYRSFTPGIHRFLNGIAGVISVRWDHIREVSSSSPVVPIFPVLWSGSQGIFHCSVAIKGSVLWSQTSRFVEFRDSSSYRLRESLNIERRL